MVDNGLSMTVVTHREERYSRAGRFETQRAMHIKPKRRNLPISCFNLLSAGVQIVGNRSQKYLALADIETDAK